MALRAILSNDKVTAGSLPRPILGGVLGGYTSNDNPVTVRAEARTTRHTLTVRTQ